MKYIDADKLKTWLENEADMEFKKTEENANSPVLCHFHNGCRMQALDTIDFIASLQQEQPSLPSNLDEAAIEYNRNYTPFDQCDSRDIRCAFKAGAEWLAGQFFPRWRNINEDKPKQGEGCACIIVTVNGHIKYSNFEDGPWFWSEKIDDELLGETEAFIGHNFYGDEEYHTCSYWMPWDEFMGALERMLKK